MRVLKRALDRSYKFQDKQHTAASVCDNTIYLPHSHIPFDPANPLSRERSITASRNPESHQDFAQTILA